MASNPPKPVLRRNASSRRMTRWMMVGGLVIAAAMVVILMRQFGDVRGGGQLSLSEQPLEFADAASCQTCHAGEYERWRGSHHDLAMQPASDATVLGDFDDATFTHGSETTRFFRRDGGFYINAPGPDGASADFPVLYTFGIHPLQQYLVDIGRGRYQSLTVAWDVVKGRWFHLQPDEFLDATDPLHWTQRAYNWNARCAECHSTNLQKHYDLATDSYATTWSEINVGCQGCHGPGSRHVSLAEEVVAGGSWGDSEARGFGFSLGDSAVAQVEACARCHARRLEITEHYTYGESLMQNYRPQLLIEPLYHADGQILDEVYVYGSFVQSKMHDAGVRCTDCHDPHTAGVKFTGNTLCVQCHQAYPPERFPTLTSTNYDTPDHHFHEAGTPGSACVDCHMPETTYMVIDPRRDHSFRVPRPDLSVLLGTPNACTGCHVSKTDEWAAEQVDEWYGKRARQDSFAGAFVRARRDDPSAASALIDVAAGDTLSSVVRATALRELRRFRSREVFEVAVDMLDNESASIRAAAVELLDALVPSDGDGEGALQKAAWLAPMLSDPVRAVRIVAARALVGLRASTLTTADQSAFNEALHEYQVAQNARADWPGSHLNLGAMHAAGGDLGAAEKEYKTALRLDPSFVEVRFNLANLYNELGKNTAALEELNTVIELDPGNDEAYYSLGLLQAEMGDMESAVVNLGVAAERMPARARVRYNWAIALDAVGRRPAAMKALGEAHVLAPRDLDIVNAIAVFHSQAGEFEQALVFARKMLALQPESVHAKQMVEALEGMTENP